MSPCPSLAQASLPLGARHACPRGQPRRPELVEWIVKNAGTSLSAGRRNSHQGLGTLSPIPLHDSGLHLRHRRVVCRLSNIPSGDSSGPSGGAPVHRERLNDERWRVYAHPAWAALRQFHLHTRRGLACPIETARFMLRSPCFFAVRTSPRSFSRAMRSSEDGVQAAWKPRHGRSPGSGTPSPSACRFGYPAESR